MSVLETTLLSRHEPVTRAFKTRGRGLPRTSKEGPSVQVARKAEN